MRRCLILPRLHALVLLVLLRDTAPHSTVSKGVIAAHPFLVSSRTADRPSSTLLILRGCREWTEIRAAIKIDKQLALYGDFAAYEHKFLLVIRRNCFVQQGICYDDPFMFAYVVKQLTIQARRPSLVEEPFAPPLTGSKGNTSPADQCRQVFAIATFLLRRSGIPVASSEGFVGNKCCDETFLGDGTTRLKANPPFAPIAVTRLVCRC